MIDGLNFPVICMFRYALIWAVSVFIYPSSDLILEWCINDSICKRRNVLALNKGFGWFIMLSIVSFRKEIVLMIWLIFMIFALIRPLEMFAIDMTSFKTFVWLIWLSYSFQMSCFIDLTSSSFAVPNKKLSSPLKGSRDLLVLISLGLWMWFIRLKASIWMEIISCKTEMMSSIVMFKRRKYLGSLLLNDSE